MDLHIRPKKCLTGEKAPNLPIVAYWARVGTKESGLRWLYKVTGKVKPLSLCAHKILLPINLS